MYVDCDNNYNMLKYTKITIYSKYNEICVDISMSFYDTCQSDTAVCSDIKLIVFI